MHCWRLNWKPAAKIRSAFTCPAWDVLLWVMRNTAPNPTPFAASPSPRASAAPEFAVTSVTDLTRARADLRAGEYAGLIVVSRTAAGDVGFAYVTEAAPDGRSAFYVRQAATAVALQDRLDRLTEHARFGFDAANAPTNNTKPVDHRRMRIRADQSIGEV